jgi:predicted Zn-dependent peptidase
MKKHVLPQSFLILTGLLFILVTTVLGQTPAKVYKYESVPNDPLNARIYKLDNGLTVYLTVYKNAPRIQTYIVVRAGSKNDPPDATGLAHYLEHLLFKGTDKFGTKDYAKEKVELDKIEALFEVYRKTTDEVKRKVLYQVIDSVSGYASQFAIANEYPKMITGIGGTPTNAYTWLEHTVYTNDIPSNQLDKWTSIEAERFHSPVFRLFHTELEAVYEEKNKSLDNDEQKTYDAMLNGLFPNNTYGSQTTLGTIDHLKNPSITKIKKYYNDFYIPNNIAICLSGDLDPDATIKLIDEKFGSWKAKPVPAYQPYMEKSITQPVVKEIMGPKAENLSLAFRFGGANTPDADMAYMMAYILSNGKAGLFDVDLNQAQKVLNANSYLQEFKDYSMHVLEAEPKNGQTLEQVKDLLLQEIEKIKNGDFPEWLLPAVITNFKLQQTKTYESNTERARAFTDAFTNDTKWAYYSNRVQRLSDITKQQLVDFVKKNYNNNYAVVYKRLGEDKTIQKVTKPSITPVQVNRTESSNFVKTILAKPVADIEPVFVDYNTDIQKFHIKNNIQVLYTPNTENKTFNLYYLFDMGTNQDKKLPVAIRYLTYLGTKDRTSTQIQQEFFKLGCSFEVYTGEEQTWISLDGLTENMEKATQLFEELLIHAQPNALALTNLITDLKKERADAKLNKDKILKEALVAYAKYGKNSPFTNILSNAELENLTANELADSIHQLTSYEHRILYYGNNTVTELTALLNKLHQTPPALKPVPTPIAFKTTDPSKNVYVVDYDMKQAEVIFLSKDGLFNKNIVPEAQLFNRYFSNGFGSIVFQEIRESRALAYSVSGSYANATKKTDNNYFSAYIATQGDKLPEAMAAMMNLIENVPESPGIFSAAKESVLQRLRSERITRADILFNYERAKKTGLDYDIRKDIFAKVPALNFPEIKAFAETHLKNKSYNVLAVGKKDALDIKTLEKYGPVTFLTLEEIFGY